MATYGVPELPMLKALKVKSDHRSKFFNLSNWKEEAWKNQGFNGISTRDLRDTGAMLYQLSYEATHWERSQFTEITLRFHLQPQYKYELFHIYVTLKAFLTTFGILFSFLLTAPHMYDPAGI